MIHILASLSFCLLACAPAPEQQQKTPTPVATPSLPLRTSFTTNALWDDGLAEVATYSSTRTIYGASRHFEYTMVTVKEDFNREYDVKTDSYSRHDLFTVLKVNLFARIPTENYPYHFLTSMFLRREDVGRLHKLTTSSQEWCGNTFKNIGRSAGLLRYSWDSYWDGEGVGSTNLDTTALFEDQLFVTLRALDFREGLTHSFALYPSMITSRATLAQPRNASLSVTTDSLAITAVATWRVTVTQSEGPLLEFWFAKDFPHVLHRYVASDGRSMMLSSIRRAAYWQN